MTNLNDIIDTAAKAYARKHGRKEIGYYALNFEAGASFATTDPLILQSLLQPFTEWINERYCNDGDLKLWRELGTLNYYSDEELIQKYFADNKQKEDGIAS